MVPFQLQTVTRQAMILSQQRRSLLLLAVLAATIAVVAGAVPAAHHLLRSGNKRRGHASHQHQRTLATQSICGSNWGDANDSCLDSCDEDEDCGPGRYCFHYMDCTPAEEEEMASLSSQASSSSSSSAGTATATTTGAAPSPTATTTTNGAPNYMPAYIASLPVRPSEPTTNAPFVLPVPTPNTLPNPNGNYCGYGYESANKECFHACPSGMDTECPGGRTCHTWLKCTRPDVDPAIYNVCGTSWAHASTTCATRCYLGDEGVCPEGETCWSGVVECEGNENLPPLTAVDVGLVNRTYTQEEIAILLDEEIERERAEEAMKDPNNWWCGTSWSNMLETCAKRCEKDEDCPGPNTWDPLGTCYKTPGGPENCKEIGVPVKDPVPPGSRWCGLSWNDMLETCSAMCEADEDCIAGKCWEATGPGTCQYIGVPVKEKSDPASLWCGIDYEDAMTSCHKPCPTESDDECDDGMSCFAGSECTVAGEMIVREGYRCGTTWDDAATKCGAECQKNEDCDVAAGQECFAEVVCGNELEAGGGMFCGVSWEGTANSCTVSCEVDDDCDEGEWCYWVECEGGDGGDSGGEDKDSSMIEEPEEVETTASCNAEVKECPNGDFVGRAQELDCEFYPCPEGGEEEAADDEDLEEMAASSESDSSAAGGESPAGGESAGGGEAPSTNSESAGGSDVMTGWGSTPLTHACTSNGSGSCGLCQGDCNSDDDCHKGLLCFSRGAGEMTMVPGCVSGGEEDKPGMDYCYAPFPPEPTTTTDEPIAMASMVSGTEETTTNPWAEEIDDEEETSEPTSVPTAEEDTSVNAWENDDDDEETYEPTSVPTAEEDTSVNAWEDDDDEEETASTAGELVYERECTEEEPCGPCEGDCDEDSHCAAHLECFMRAKGSVEFVTGCTGLGTAGMDYCYDPNTPTPPPMSASNGEVVGGCSAEVYFCPGGHVVHQDPENNCEFNPCPTSASSMVAASAAADEFDELVPTAMPSTSTPTFDASEAATPPMEEVCDELCLEKLPAELCPTNLTLLNCLEVGLGEICEANGECGTDDKLNNCGTYDVYARVVCGFDTPSQGELMRSTTSPTPSVPPQPLAAAVTSTVAPAPVPNPNAASDILTTNHVASSAGNPTSATVSISDAIANATANANTTQSSSSSLQGPSTPPIQEYESNVAAAFTFDRDQGSGGTNEAASATEDGSSVVGSDEWYDSGIGESSGNSDGAWEAPDGGWDFDTSYFEKPISSGIPSWRISLCGAMLIIVEMMTIVLFAC